MERAKLNFIIDIFLGITFLIMAVTSIALFFRIRFTGISWMHTYIGMLFIILAFIHFFLHWNWYVCMIKGMIKKKECKE